LKISVSVAKQTQQKKRHEMAFFYFPVYLQYMNEQSPHFYLSGHETFTAMLSLCTAAQKSIELEQYIFSNDEIGKKFVEVLRERAWAGVKIRILCDTVGSWSLYTSDLPKLMEKDGIEIRFVNPVGPWRMNSFFSWFFRDHRKILIIDKKIGITGGTGIRDDMHTWRDTNVEVHGTIVHEMSVAFEEMWERTANKDLVSRIQRARQYTRGFQFITSAPYLKKRFLYYSVMDALRNTKKYAFITTPYFIPDRRLVRILKLAVKRGIDVRVLVPSKGVEPFVDRASRSHYEPLLKAGVRIFEYHSCFLHAKSIVIDDEWSSVGSFNLDSLSFIYNYEANIVSTDEAFIHSLKGHFLTDLNSTNEIHYKEWVSRPRIQKLRELAVMPIRGFL